MSAYRTLDLDEVLEEYDELRSRAEEWAGWQEAPEAIVCPGHNDDTDCEEPNGPCRSCIEEGFEGDGDPLDTIDAERLLALESFDGEVGGIQRAVNDGLELIDDSDFAAYAAEYADSVGDIPEWLSSYIDWEKFAHDLEGDYSSISFDGTDYLYRA